MTVVKPVALRLVRRLFSYSKCVAVIVKPPDATADNTRIATYSEGLRSIRHETAIVCTACSSERLATLASLVARLVDRPVTDDLSVTFITWRMGERTSNISSGH